MVFSVVVLVAQVVHWIRRSSTCYWWRSASPEKTTKTSRSCRRKIQRWYLLQILGGKALYFIHTNHSLKSWSKIVPNRNWHVISLTWSKYLHVLQEICWWNILYCFLILISAVCFFLQELYTVLESDSQLDQMDMSCFKPESSQICPKKLTVGKVINIFGGVEVTYIF